MPARKTSTVSQKFWGVMLVVAFFGGTLFFFILGVEILVFQWTATPVEGVVLELSDHGISGNRRSLGAKVELALDDGAAAERFGLVRSEFDALKRLPSGERRTFWVAPSITGRQIHLERRGHLARPWGLALPLGSMLPFTLLVLLVALPKKKKPAEEPTTSP